MPDIADPQQHVKPFVHETPRSKALHFSLSEIQSRMQLHEPDALDLEYTRTMMGFLLLQPAPRRLSMIGLGGGSLAKFCHRHLPRTQIRVLEINPHVIALREAFQVPPDDGRFAVVCGDGAKLVREAAQACDVLLVDGYDSDGLPARLCSQRFYYDCHAALQPGGVMVANLHVAHKRFDICVDRIRRRFDDSALVVDCGDLSNSIVFAFKGCAPGLLRERMGRVPKGLCNGPFNQLRASFAAIGAAAAEQFV